MRDGVGYSYNDVTQHFPCSTKTSCNFQDVRILQPIPPALFETVNQFYNPIYFLSRSFDTRHNSGDSVLTSNLVCIKEVAIRTTFSHMVNILLE